MQPTRARVIRPDVASKLCGIQNLLYEVRPPGVIVKPKSENIAAHAISANQPSANGSSITSFSPPVLVGKGKR